MSVRAQIVGQFAEQLGIESQPSFWADELGVETTPAELPAIVAIAQQHGARLVAVWGEGHGDEPIAWYALEAPSLIVLIAAVLDPSRPEVPSLAVRNPGVAWMEREMHEACGFVVTGQPAADPLRTPARPDIKIDGHGVSVYPLGPVRSNGVESAHIHLSVASERIVHADPRLFYKHRSVEQHGRGRPVAQLVALAERVCGSCSLHNAMGLVVALERLSGIDVPKRADWLRTAWLEIERVTVHAAAMESLFAVSGWVAGAEQAVRARNGLRAAIEQTLGARMIRGLVRYGGVRRDLAEPTVLVRAVQRATSTLRGLAHQALELDSVRPLWTNLGHVSLELAADFALSGPVARAVGVRHDARRDHPYLAYAELTTWAPVYWTGDAVGRLRVWQDELEQSATLTDELLSNLPSGRLVAEDEPMPPNERAVALIEAPHGAALHAVQTDAEGRVASWHLSPPGMKTWPAMATTMVGNELEVVTMLERSFGLCVACVDR